jgi:hypothetical protein
MPAKLFSLSLSKPALIAAALTLLSWWLFSFLTPDAPLGVSETAVVFLVFFGIAQGVVWLLARRKKSTEKESDA